MATIAFLLDHEEGHLLPSFGLARRLADRGHRVTYLGVPDSAPPIVRNGFAFMPILEEVFPSGSIQALQEETREMEDEAAGRLLYERYLGPMARGEGCDGAIRALRPDLLVTTSFQGARALVLHYRYRLPVVLLTPWLRPGTRAEYLNALEGTLVRLNSGTEELLALARRVQPGARKLGEVTAPFLRMRELILCPEELEIPDPSRQRERETFYVEASIDLRRGDGAPLPALDRGRRLLYVSLGSQLFRLDREAGARFLRMVIAAFADSSGWQLVLTTRGILEPEDVAGLPPWVTLTPWVPQLEILRHAAVMITHGGLGTVKECIFRGVPMIVFPMVTDQPDNARRIVHHGLGLRGDLNAATPGEIFELVQRVDGDPVFRDNVARMRRTFETVEESGIGARRIEEVLERRR